MGGKKAGQLMPPRSFGCQSVGTQQGHGTAHIYSLKPVSPPELEKSESG